MDTLNARLRSWRNAPFPPRVFRWEEEGVGVDLTGMTFEMDVRAIPGEGPALISLSTAANDTDDGIRVVEASAGRFRIQIDQASMQAAYDAAGVRAGATAALFYDLLVIGVDGIPEALIEGDFIIEPGVTL